MGANSMDCVKIWFITAIFANDKFFMRFAWQQNLLERAIF